MSDDLPDMWEPADFIGGATDHSNSQTWEEQGVPHQCPDCGTLTVYQSYSGGREYYCPTCKDGGLYPEGAAPPRVQLLADGKYDELQQDMREEIIAIHEPGDDRNEENPQAESDTAVVGRLIEASGGA